MVQNYASLKYLFALAVGLLAPIQGLMVLVGIFIIIDTIMGVIAAKQKKIPITSRRLSRFIGKMFIYQIIIIVAFALDTLILGGLVSLFITSITLVITKIAALMLILNEVFSIDEKIRLMNDGKGIWFHFKRLLGVASRLKKEAGDLGIEMKDLKELKKD